MGRRVVPAGFVVVGVVCYAMIAGKGQNTPIPGEEEVAC